MTFYHSVIHLATVYLHVPCLALINFRKTHKFSLTCILWDTKKLQLWYYNFRLYSFERASDRIQRYGTAYFANIHILVIRAFFHIKQKNCAILVMKQFPLVTCTTPKARIPKWLVILKTFCSWNSNENTPVHLWHIFNPQALDWRA